MELFSLGVEIPPVNSAILIRMMLRGRHSLLLSSFAYPESWFLELVAAQLLLRAEITSLLF
jgi:hypothetical protein